MSTSIFAHVDHVDACGAPVLAAGAPDLCENEMPGDTVVAIYGVAGSAKTAGFLCNARLALAERDMRRGHLRRIGARSFEVTSLAAAIGAGLTATQKRRRHLAEVNG